MLPFSIDVSSKIQCPISHNNTVMQLMNITQACNEYNFRSKSKRRIQTASSQRERFLYLSFTSVCPCSSSSSARYGFMFCVPIGNATFSIWQFHTFYKKWPVESSKIIFQIVYCKNSRADYWITMFTSLFLLVLMFTRFIGWWLLFHLQSHFPLFSMQWVFTSLIICKGF